MAMMNQASKAVELRMKWEAAQASGDSRRVTEVETGMKDIDWTKIIKGDLRTKLVNTLELLSEQDMINVLAWVTNARAGSPVMLPGMMRAVKEVNPRFTSQVNTLQQSETFKSILSDAGLLEHRLSPQCLCFSSCLLFCFCCFCWVSIVYNGL